MCSALTHLARDLLERGDPVVGAGMRREQVVHTATGQRVDNIDVRHGRHVFGRLVRELPRELLQLAQRRGEPERVPRDRGANPVGLVLSRPADRHLHEAGRERRHQNDEQGAEKTATVVA